MAPGTQPIRSCTAIPSSICWRGAVYRDASGQRRSLDADLAPHLEAWAEERPQIERKQDAVRRERSGPSPLRATPSRNLYDVFDIVTRPDRYAVKAHHAVSPFLLLLFALPFCLRAAATRRGPLLWVIGLALLLYLPLASQLGVVRYLLPLLPVFSVAAGVVLARFSGLLWQLGWGVALGGLLALQLVASIGQLAGLGPGEYFAGRSTRLEWLGGAGYNGSTAMPRVIAALRAQQATGAIEPDARILMAGEGKGRLLGVGYLPDASWSFQRWLAELLNADRDLERLAERLRERGITHVLYNKRFFIWVLEETDTSRTRLSFGTIHLKRFIESQGEVVFETDGMQLARIAGGDGP